MSSSNTSAKGFIKLGRFKTPLIEFSPFTTMADINHFVYNYFNNYLPSALHIEFYSDKIKKFVRLDEHVLSGELNPFQNNNEQFTDPMDDIYLFIVEDSSPTDALNLQSKSSISSNESDDHVTDMTSLGELDDDSFLKSIFPEGLHDNDSFNKISSNEIFDDDDFIRTILSDESNGALPSPLFTPNLSNAVVSQNNISINNSNDNIIEDDSDVLVSEHTINFQIDSQNFLTSSNDSQLATQATDENNRDSNRIRFSLDVQPRQKHHYLSNKYNTDDGSDEHGGISYIQGVKSEDETKKKIQVLPHIEIPLLYRNMERIDLLLYAVFEEQEDGMRVWYKNRHKGFLLNHQLKPDAEFFNPILLNLHHTQWKSNGDYALEIYLLTKRDKVCKIKEEIYRLDETAVDQLHKADHIISSTRKHIKPTRLLAVFKFGNEPCWHTCGLSDFIQPPCKNISLTPMDSTTAVQIPLPSTSINVNAIHLPVVFQSSIQNLQPTCVSNTTLPPVKRQRFN